MYKQNTYFILYNIYTLLKKRGKIENDGSKLNSTLAPLSIDLERGWG